jgi:hypothetical protein
MASPQGDQGGGGRLVGGRSEWQMATAGRLLRMPPTFQVSEEKRHVRLGIVTSDPQRTFADASHL